MFVDERLGIIEYGGRMDIRESSCKACMPASNKCVSTIICPRSCCYTEHVDPGISYGVSFLASPRCMSGAWVSILVGAVENRTTIGSLIS